MFGNHQNSKKKQSSSSIVPLATMIALIGGIGAAVITNPKAKKVREELVDVGDDLVDALERVLDKIDKNSKEAPGFGQVSEFVMHAYTEIKALNDSGAEDRKVTVTERVHDTVVKDVEKVESVAQHVEDDISQKIAWLQRKGRTLAKRSISK